MIYLITIVVFALAFLGLGLGVMLAGKRLSGSCGGVGPGGEGDCACKREGRTPPPDCPSQHAREGRAPSELNGLTQLTTKPSRHV